MTIDHRLRIEDFYLKMDTGQWNCGLPMGHIDGVQQTLLGFTRHLVVCQTSLRSSGYFGMSGPQEGLPDTDSVHQTLWSVLWTLSSQSSFSFLYCNQSEGSYARIRP